jgi:2-phosphosulfolactate phosphatase
MNNIRVCFSVDFFHKYADEKSIVVVVDILRATSVISTAFEYGIKEIIPVKSLKETLKFNNRKDHILAAERNTVRIQGFKYGNSPFHYMKPEIRNKILVLTTTNGTKAIELAKNHHLITASFINIDIVVEYLKAKNNDVIILCSGWKGFFNLEDTIFAGALAQKLLKTNSFCHNCDSLNASIQLYNNASDNIFSFLSSSSYRKRNDSDEIINDTLFCLKPKIISRIIPILKKDRLVKEKFY